MPHSDVLRFDDIRVGQQLPSTAAAKLGDNASWPSLAERYVQDWAGRGARVAARAASAAPAAGEEIDELIGSVYARHLDDSLNVDVQVIGRTRSGTRLVDIVRVRLN